MDDDFSGRLKIFSKKDIQLKSSVIASGKILEVHKFYCNKTYI